MGGQSCKLKIILNGGTIQDELARLCYHVEEAELDDSTGYKMVEALNHAEDLVFRAKHLWLESQGFTGPWPHSLDFKS